MTEDVLSGIFLQNIFPLRWLGGVALNSSIRNHYKSNLAAML